ncbi:uncharacterized protein LOC107621730 [Arachis ipaensis]|uniref:uncharacterized protein LOC107621730 n=1 Tax=Arachis ipaensis TaxID=130454 RepID=UPI000A2B76A9|nr:uncharacterized protein LOC107621730 [Arachis ipaensis]XP_020969511.1 uncharacterized protein LOC107621730 [Arachis ipaensis]XP_020969512.1 uncharacterized protein LOC107621730 [Arachis ipaensis]XP_025684224.1 protein RICE SALT SENSITIVE 3 [Arachis hypogaea]XP_025684225.1 protein RICE SALT SENSITIVE 3 [Arachis hypogaea]XP_025684226.1 protein RICE SALT SENSITIVE 3 [Arachis hypogaea]
MCLLILVWEDGFCNFAASGAAPEINSVELNKCRLIGKVAADHSHKWIYKEPNEQEINFLSVWHNSSDSDLGSTVPISNKDHSFHCCKRRCCSIGSNSQSSVSTLYI